MTATIHDVDRLVDVLRSPAATDRDGELVTIEQHLLQCAAILRDRNPGDDVLQVAGLVHDIGTVLEPDRPASHATTGADAVHALFGDRVAALVADHDLAKRYLVATDPGYRARLTARSIETLAEQGGPLDDRARMTFESSDRFDACLALRRADDDAKVPGLHVGALDDWLPVLHRVALRSGSTDPAG